MFLFRSLASGSSGNAYLLRTGKVSILIDAGIRLPRLVRYLQHEDLEPQTLSALLISHEHRDHCTSAHDLAHQFRVPVCANSEVLTAIGLADAPRTRLLDTGRPALFGDVEVTPFAVSHDAVRPVGFMIRAQGRTIVIATDLGEVTPEVSEAVRQADLAVIEANHDLEMLHNGRYPYHLRRRVAGPTGHLSNSQAASLVVNHAKGHATDIWLAHLSKENNTPALAARTVRRCLKEAGMGGMYVDVALRDRPSLRWTGVPRPRQLGLFEDGALL